MSSIFDVLYILLQCRDFIDRPAVVANGVPPKLFALLLSQPKQATHHPFKVAALLAEVHMLNIAHATSPLFLCAFIATRLSRGR